VLPLAVSVQRMKPVARRNTHVLNRSCRVQISQSSFPRGPDGCWESARFACIPKVSGDRVCERPYHAAILLINNSTVKRYYYCLSLTKSIDPSTRVSRAGPASQNRACRVPSAGPSLAQDDRSMRMRNRSRRAIARSGQKQ
jgi:hypothetical protein